MRAAKDKSKVGSFAAPHYFSHTTRANISREIAKQIRARIVCTPAYKGAAGVDLVSALTGVTISLLQWGIDRFAEQTRSASPRLGQKVARFTATDEVLSYMYYQNKPYLAMFAPGRAPKSEPRGSP